MTAKNYYTKKTLFYQLKMKEIKNKIAPSNNQTNQTKLKQSTAANCNKLHDIRYATETALGLVTPTDF